jgi:hypothetical protein
MFTGCSAKQEIAAARYDLGSSTELIIAQIVKIRARRDGEQRIGTGVIMGFSRDAANIVTAVDVVGPGSRAEVEFFTRLNRLVSASLVGLETQASSESALLQVTGKENIPIGLSPLPLPPSALLERGDAVLVIGFSRVAGPLSVIKGNMVSREGWHIMFDQALDEGYSGSPIIQYGQVVGLVTEVIGFYGRVTPTASIQRLVGQSSPPALAEEIMGGLGAIIGGTAHAAVGAGVGRLFARRPSRETGRSFLVGNQLEDQGYGLYSYLLFGSPPTDVTRDRYRAVVTAFFDLIPAMPALEEFLPRGQLNVTYLLLHLPPPTSHGPQEHADWILESHHYTRARVLLSAVPGAHREGPYLVSSRNPLTLSGTEIIGEPYLYQDLSSVPPRLVQLWVKEFLSQAAQERFEEKTMQRWVLKLRTAIAILAEGLPEVREAFAEWGKGSSSLQEGINRRIVRKP